MLMGSATFAKVASSPPHLAFCLSQHLGFAKANITVAVHRLATWVFADSIRSSFEAAIVFYDRWYTRIRHNNGNRLYTETDL